MQLVILKELFQDFCITLVSLLTLIIIGNAMHMRSELVNLNLGFFEILNLFFYMTPAFLLMIFPISCMLSVFLTFLRMSTDRELIALKSGGVSIYQLLYAPLVFCTICMLTSLFISMHGISWGSQKFRNYLLEMANTRARVVVQPGVFNQDLLGKTLFARKVDPATGELEQVIFEDISKDGATTMVFIAPKGIIYTDEEKGELLFTLYNGKIYQTNENKVHVASFEVYTVNIDLKNFLSGMAIKELRPKDMSWKSLVAMQYNNSAPNKRFQNKVAVEIQKRISLPVACLLLGIFAMPLACSFEGVRQQYGILLALVLFFIYYSLFSTGVSMAESGQASPGIAVWAANIIFAVGTCFGINFAAKERSLSLQFYKILKPINFRKE